MYDQVTRIYQYTRKQLALETTSGIVLFNEAQQKLIKSDYDVVSAKVVDAHGCLHINNLQTRYVIPDTSARDTKPTF